MNGQQILVVGLSAAGAESLPESLRERIVQADVLLGGRRHLAYFPDFPGETLIISANIDEVVHRLQRAVADRQKAVVLASGDPLWYGIGATLRRYFPADSLSVIPSPTAIQLAFAALGESWHEAQIVSAHGRPLQDALGQVVEAGPQGSHLAAPKAAFLTDGQNSPTAIAAALLDIGLPPDSPCAICQNLGSDGQQITRTVLAQVDQLDYAALNVFVIWRSITPVDVETSAVRLAGLPDAAYTTSAGQITKREIRLLTLAELGVQPGEVVWDIGAGSGAVSLEVARTQPTARVYAIEKRAEMCRHIRENLHRFPAPNLNLTEGLAPTKISDWPDPHAIFIGGSGGQLKPLIALAQQRLFDNGRLVINLATLENLSLVRQLLPEAQVSQVQINRAVPILDMLRFEAQNPVFMVTWRK